MDHISAFPPADASPRRSFPIHAARARAIARAGQHRIADPVLVEAPRFGDLLAQVGLGPQASDPTVLAHERTGCTAGLGNRQLDTFKAAIARSGAKVGEAFVAVLAPGWLDHFIFNEYYKTEEEFLFALADALREEYRAVVAAGFVLQIDDPGLPDWWDMLKPEPTIEAYRKFARLRIDAVNHALAGIPEEKVRYHLCWGSWHGPHAHDLPLEHIIDLILEVKAQTYSFEAANVRHEHEWRVWQQAKLPAGKMLMPGVVSHATNLVEHPQLVADRILRYTAIVGRENIIAGTDCGLGGRVHADLVWAKLRALVEGARLASGSLWS